jgi:plastocyanin
VVSFIGLRSEGFPKKALGRLVVLLFTVLVVGTAVTAVALSREEAEHREHEQAEAEAEELAEAEAEGEAQEAEEAPGEPAGGQEVPDGGEPAPGATTTLQLAADPEGLLIFDPEELTAKAGELVIEFDNPSPTPHDVVIEGEGDEELGATPQISSDKATLRVAEIEPGEYTYYCSVLGHRESGMEGTLTVE